MKKFRIYNLKIEEKNFFTEEIKLVKSENDYNGNYFTLIIGNNGSGKSKILSSIARLFLEELRDNKQRTLFGSNIIYNRFPEKIIAITNSISDKFPMDESFRPSGISDKKLFRDFKYNYLGTRNRINSFSNKALMNRALDILFENYSELDVSRNYRLIFDYLDYEPIIKLVYKIKSKILERFKGNFNPEELLEYLKNAPFSSGFRRVSFESLEKIEKGKMQELCDFLNTHRYIDNEILINFSEKNIFRISKDKSKYKDNVYAYNMLSLLIRLDIIRNIEINVYKKGGFEFNFNDASSGESNILSTLIALVPLIQDNSLILIDEPEISLHPLWQTQYITLINKIFSRFSGCHIIIASHSHFMVSDLPPEYSSVVSLENKKGLIVSKMIKESTFGWSAEDILLNVFGLPSTRNFFLSQKISRALELLADHNRSEIELKELKKEILNLYPLIKEYDPLKKVAQIIIDEKKYE